MKTLLSALIVIAVVTPALAVAQFFIVRDNKSRQCFVSDTRPSSSTQTIVGDGTIYRSLADAQAAIKTVRACNGP